MNEIPQSLLVALISALIALLSLIISKEQKISEFRQEWINSLRNDISDLLSLANRMAMEADVFKEITEIDGVPKLADIRNSISDIVSDAYPAYYRISLNLNPKEHSELLNLIDELEKTLSNSKLLTDPNKFTELCGKLNDEARITLKKEWVRVKKGEPIYQLTKRIFIFSILFFILLTFFVLLCS